MVTLRQTLKLWRAHRKDSLGRPRGMGNVAVWKAGHEYSRNRYRNPPVRPGKENRVVEDVDKKEVVRKEGVYFAFPFAIEHPEFQYEIQNGVVDPAKDMYAGAGHEWFSLQHWISADQDGLSATLMPLDASLVTLGDIDRGPMAERIRHSHRKHLLLSDEQLLGPIIVRGRAVASVFATSSPARPPPIALRLSHLGWEEMTQLEKDEITTQDKALDTPGPLDGKQASFLRADDPNLVLTTWKPAEDGHGTILRFLDLGGATRTITVEAPMLQLQQAVQTDAVERDQSKLTLSGTHQFQFTVHPHEIVTVRLEQRQPRRRPPATGSNPGRGSRL